MSHKEVNSLQVFTCVCEFFIIFINVCRIFMGKSIWGEIALDVDDPVKPYSTVDHLNEWNLSIM